MEKREKLPQLCFFCNRTTLKSGYDSENSKNLVNDIVEWLFTINNPVFKKHFQISTKGESPF